MEWQDRGIVTHVKKLGENSAIVTVFTKNYGRHAGLVKGAMGRKKRGFLQPGALVSVRWQARLEEHLGRFNFEGEKSMMPSLIATPSRLLALASMMHLLEVALPERQADQEFFHQTDLCLANLGQDDWLYGYVIWELALLRAIGFGLDLSCCAATGQTTDLVYISPKTGRAVSRMAGKPYHQRMLPLPAFLRNGAAPDSTDLLTVLSITTHFFTAHIFDKNPTKLPISRSRMIGALTPNLKKAHADSPDHAPTAYLEGGTGL